MDDLAHNLQNATPFDLSKQEIDDLFDEAKAWLDGSTVSSQDEADAIAKLLDLTRKAKKTADDNRKAEAKPFDDGKAEVQVRYKPILTKADQIASACKAAVTPFLEAQEREKREREARAREEAERQRMAAEEAMRASSSNDIEARAAAEAKLEEAKEAEAHANYLSRQKGQAKGGDRAMGLRTSYRAELTDLNDAIRHYWKTHRAEFEALVCDLAAKDVRAGKRQIPGFNVIEERTAV